MGVERRLAARVPVKLFCDAHLGERRFRAVASDLSDLAFIQNYDLMSIFDRGKSMRDHKHRSALHEIVDRFLHQELRLPCGGQLPSRRRRLSRRSGLSGHLRQTGRPGVLFVGDLHGDQRPVQQRHHVLHE